MDLVDWKEKVSQCVKCGSCLSVCPIYKETGQETLVARGKLALLSGYFSNLLPANREIYDLLSNCLLCGACAENCPAGVAADDLVLQGRGLFIEKTGLTNWKKLLSGQLLPFPNRLKALSKVQTLLFKKIPDESGLRLRFPFDQRHWPALSPHFFLEQISSLRQSKPSPSLRIGYFVGCLTNYLYPAIGEATWKLLASLGAVVIPIQQTCCGLPAFSLGDFKTAGELARKNIQAFPEDLVDVVVVSCSSCAAHLKVNYPLLLKEDPLLRTKGLAFVRKIEELSQFLVPFEKNFQFRGLIPPETDPPPLRLTFHDPCHAKRKLKIFQEPRRLLSLIPGAGLIEQEGQYCCGGGGLFHLSQPDLSARILDHPLKDLDNSGVDIITTSCLACLLQWKEGVAKTGRKVQVKHWAELLGKYIFCK